MSLAVQPPTNAIELQAVGASVGVLPSRTRFASRVRDFVTLSKPRIAVMGLVTVALGFMLATQAEWSGLRLAHALFGIGLVAVSCSVLNQWLERDSDRLMPRTVNRPLASGRLSPNEALSFGVIAALLGLGDLLVSVNPLTALLTFGTLVMYVGIYTPLKRYTPLCTAVGAIPGAMPPVLGWTAAGGELDAGAFALFATLFVWQFPHFLAIAWLYRQQYAAAGLKMLPQVEPGRGIVGWMCVGHAVTVIPVSLLLKDAALAGDLFGIVAVVLGIGYVTFAVRFLRDESVRTARQLMWFSLIYLPALLLALTWDHWRLLS